MAAGWRTTTPPRTRSSPKPWSCVWPVRAPRVGGGPWHQRSPHPCHHPPPPRSPVSHPFYGAQPDLNAPGPSSLPYKAARDPFPRHTPDLLPRTCVAPQSSGDKTHILHPSLQDPPGWPPLRWTPLLITPQALLLFPTVIPHLLFRPIPTHLSGPSLPRSLLGPPAHKP